MKSTSDEAARRRQALIEHLNEDLAGELQAIVMYTQYSALLQGPFRKELRDLFQAEIPDELRHAQFLADKISVFGGTPVTTPREVPAARDALEMLEKIYLAEQRALRDYANRAQEADAAGEVGLKVELENLVVDETRHKEEVEQLLNGWHRDAGRTETAPLPDPVHV